MRTFVLIMMCLHGLSLAISFFRLALKEWPEERQPKTAGQEFAEGLFNMGFLVLALVLLFP